MTNDAEKARLRRWEIFFEIALVILLAITALAWTWKDALIVLFFGGTVEWFISEARRKLETQSHQQTIGWLKRRLEVVDPHWQEDLMNVTPGDQRLHPPPNEILCKCPKCNRPIRRRELDPRYNGGWSASQA